MAVDKKTVGDLKDMTQAEIDIYIMGCVVENLVDIAVEKGLLVPVEPEIITAELCWSL